MTSINLHSCKKTNLLVPAVPSQLPVAWAVRLMMSAGCSSATSNGLPVQNTTTACPFSLQMLLIKHKQYLLWGPFRWP
jgi:hypothetical protein